MPPELPPYALHTAVLADTSVWIHHFRLAGAGPFPVGSAQRLAMHPAVIGELACGNLPARETTLPRMRIMWSLRPAKDAEVLQLIEGHRLHGRGVGWIDCHLLAACKLRGPSLWTRDKRLREVAAEVLGEGKVWA